MEHPYIKDILKKYNKNNIIINLSKKYGYEPYMIARYIEILGTEETEMLLEANEKPLPKSLRCNNIIIDCNKLEKRLKNKGFRLKKLTRFSPYIYLIEHAPYSPGATHEYLLGYYYLQGPVSASIVHGMDLKRNYLILDMAAAPGGKATQILQLIEDKGILIAVEKNKRRIKSLRANIQRMRFKNYIIYHYDNRKLPFKEEFDSILLDAPSTGEGIIRKDPRRKTSRTPFDLLEIHRLQVSMLLKAVEYLKPEKTLVYAACSLAPEEGELVIDTILKKLNNIDIIPMDIPGDSGISEYFGVQLDSRISMCKRFWPHRQGFEGFFACKIRKRGEK